MYQGLSMGNIFVINCLSCCCTCGCQRSNTSTTLGCLHVMALLLSSFGAIASKITSCSKESSNKTHRPSVHPRHSSPTRIRALGHSAPPALAPISTDDVRGTISGK
jgi:hypothetical protein